MSDYNGWTEKDHASEWHVFPANVGEYLSMDETALSDGELYTIVTNRAAKGKKGAIVSIVEGTAGDKVIEAIEKIPQDKREQVKEVTLDLSDSMRKTVRRCFPNADRVTDRFHVQKPAYDALQEMRIAHRRDAINEETDAMEEARLSGKKYVPQTLENGDSKKQLPARSRYLLFKPADKWTDKQKHGARLLFELCPDIKKAYSLTHSLRMIFSKNNIKNAARLRLARWYNEVADSEFNPTCQSQGCICPIYRKSHNFDFIYGGLRLFFSSWGSSV